MKCKKREIKTERHKEPKLLRCGEIQGGRETERQRDRQGEIHIERKIEKEPEPDPELVKENNKHKVMWENRVSLHVVACKGS